MGLLPRREALAIGDRTWSRFLVDLTALLPGTTFRKASEITSPIRSVKEPNEIGDG